MRNQGICVVFVEGLEITLTLRRVLQSVTVSDRAGTSSDTANLVIDDSLGLVRFPRHNAKVSIFMGTRSTGISQVFFGNVDEVRSAGGRSGQTIKVSAKGLDTSGKVKEPQRRHFDNLSILNMLQAAGAAAGVTDVRVDATLGAITRPYEAMDSESFVAFGERLAGEIGGTFKVRNEIAVMARKNSGTTPKGEPLAPVSAVYGENLHDWDIAPYIGRKRYSQIRVKYYDKEAATHKEVVIDTGVEGSTAQAVGRFEAANKEEAEEKARALKAETQAGSGSGVVTIEGNAGASPEATCFVVGAKIGIDRGYVIDGVDHKYDRGTGYVTSLSLGYPL